MMAMVQTPPADQAAKPPRNSSISKIFRSSSQASRSEQGPSTNEDILSIRNGSIGGESTKSSRKSSIPSILRRGSTFSVTSRSKRSKADEPVPAPASTNTFGILFANLPAELKTQVISCLDFRDILVLRRTAPDLKVLVDYSELDVVNYHIKHKLDSHTLSLFPPPKSPHLNLAYLSQVHHRLIYSTKLARCIADYTRDEIYRRTSVKLRKSWSAEHSRLCTGFIAPILTLFKFFETYRETLIKVYVFQSGPELEEIFSRHPYRIEMDLLLKEFTGPQIREAYEMYQLLFQALNRYWRPPSYATRAERMVRGWTTDPPSGREYSILVMTGGIREITKTWNSHKSYAGRRKYFDSTVERLANGSKSTSNPFASSYTFQDTRPSPEQRQVQEEPGAIGPDSCTSIPLNDPERFQMPMKPLTREIATSLAPYLPPIDTIWRQAAESAMLQKGAITHMDQMENYTLWIERLIKDENGTNDAGLAGTGALPNESEDGDVDEESEAEAEAEAEEEENEEDEEEALGAGQEEDSVLGSGHPLSLSNTNAYYDV